MTDPNASSLSWTLDDFSSFYDQLNFSLIYDQLNFTHNDSFVPDPGTLACVALLQLPPGATVTISIFYVLVFLLAVPGNLLVALVIGLSKQPLPPSDLYLLHLAIADLLLAATLPFWAVSVAWEWLFGAAACKLITVLQELSFYSSILFLTCISVDRYMVIVRAVDARRANRQRFSLNVCMGVWVLGGFLSLPGFFFSSAYVSNTTGHYACAEHYDTGSADEWRLATRILRHALGFVIPLAVMLPCYGITVCRLLRVRRGFQRQRAMRVIVVVLAAFLLCWTPYHLTVMVDSFYRTKLVPYSCGARLGVDRALFATQSLGLLHSCINPMLYAFVGEKFRRRLLQLLRKAGLVERAVGSRASRSSLSSEITSTVM